MTNSIKPYSKFTDATGTRVYAVVKGVDAYIDFDNNGKVTDGTFKVDSKLSNKFAAAAKEFLN